MNIFKKIGTLVDKMRGKKKEPEIGRRRRDVEALELWLYSGLGSLGYAHRLFVISKPGTRPKKVELPPTSSHVLTGSLHAYEFEVIDDADYLSWIWADAIKSSDLSFDDFKIDELDLHSVTPRRMLPGLVDKTMTHAPRMNLFRVWSNVDLTEIEDVVLVGRIDTVTIRARKDNLLLGDFEPTDEIPQINMKTLSTIFSSAPRKRR